MEGLLFEEPKTASSRPLIVLPKQLVAELRAHKDAQAAERRRPSTTGPTKTWCFPRSTDGRHTAATLLLAEGIHPRVVMEPLGHSAMRTTTDTYSHVMPALAQQAADRMDAALWGVSEADAKTKKRSKGKRSAKSATETATSTDQGP